MILAVDIGNTNIVIGCCENDEILFIERLSTNQTATVLEYAVSIKNVFELNNVKTSQIEGSVISSVVPSVTNTVNDAIFKTIGKKSLIVGPGIKTGLSIVIDNPAQLGSDLVVDAVAGLAYYPLPLAIIDMGTATTVTVIDSKRNCIGGIIMPGMKISLDSLTGRTSQLPKISLDAPKKVIGSNTIDCMKSGIIYGTAGNIDGIIDRIEDELGEKVTAVATGGLAELVIPHCRREIILDNELLLKGLMLIYNKNK
ncbi:MAG: type III pantothenate kinase [Ruminococcus sp.]|nr:type III pantothenate kinase [Ruminococcus sp.]